MSDNQLLEVIEKYLNGEMTEDERARFEKLRNENADVNDKVAEHKHFTNLIKQYGERLELEKRLNAIHDEIDVHTLEDELMIHPSWIVRMWRNHHSKISVAASIAIFAVLCTMFFTGYLANRNNDFITVKGKIDRLEHSAHDLSSKIKQLDGKGGKVYSNPGNIRGTGFAIASNGFVATDYHVIRNADSIYIQNVDGKSFRAKVLYADPQSDVAILQVNDPSFTSFGTIPYGIKKSESDIGENVFTVGYPRDDMVLGPGFLTSGTGYRGDTTSYQVSISVNPGNSGGPLLDDKGNLIGLIEAKETNLEGAGFAIKSGYLLKAIQDIPSDSIKKPLTLNFKNVLANLNRVQQIKKMKNYVFMVKVY